MTWDGRISTRNRTPSLFSSPRDKARLLELRAGADAVMVGRATVENDRMTLGLPDAQLRRQRLERGQSEYPLRVVVSASGELSPSLPLLQAEGLGPLHLFSTQAMPEATRAALTDRATLHLAPQAVDLPAILTTLKRDHGVERLLCEGGPTLLRALLELGLIDELNLTLCPLLFGGEAAPTLTGAADAPFLEPTRTFRLDTCESGEAGEWFLRYQRRGRGA